jgi:hypothetical protein
VAIKKPIPGAAAGTPPVTMPAFSFAPNDGLAALIVDAWGNKAFRDQLLERNPPNSMVPSAAAVQLATLSVNERCGFNLKRAVVISEKEHDSDYIMQDPDEVVFVLPNDTRLKTGFSPSSSLIETARVLMACTPNGI